MVVFAMNKSRNLWDGAHKFILRSFFLSLFLSFTVCRAMIQRTQMTSTDMFAEFNQASFGMASGGVIEGTYSVQPSNPQLPFGSHLIILILTESQKAGWYGDASSSDPLTDGQIANMCEKPSSRRITLSGAGSGNFSYPINSLEGDQYSVLLLQCYKSRSSPANLRLPTSPSDNPVNIDVTISMKNALPRPSGSTQNSPGQNTYTYTFLPINNVMMLHVYVGELIVYFFFFIGLLGQIMHGGGGLNPNTGAVRKIHYFFLVTLVLCILYTGVQYAEYYQASVTGYDPSVLNIGSNILSHLTSVSSLLSLLLLSLGWSTVRMFLYDREKRLIFIFVFIYLIVGLGGAVCTDSSDQCKSLWLATYILKSLILLGIIIAMNFTVTQLRSSIMHTNWVLSVPVQYAHCKRYQVLRLVFIVYLLLPTCFLLIQATMLTWKQDWIVTMLNDTLVLFMFFHIGTTFSPLQEGFIVRAFDGTFNADHNARSE